MAADTSTRIVWEKILRQAICIRVHSFKVIFFVVIIIVIAWTISQTRCLTFDINARTGQGNSIQGANANAALQETEAPIHTDTRVILLTYMRSGSTFTSELFQTHPDVFFMFEPLHTTWYYQPKVIPYLHNYKRIYFDDMEKFITDVKIDTLTKILQCQFRNLDILTLIQEHWHHSKTTKAYKLCTMDQRGVAGIEKCISILTNACSRAKVNFIKTINLTIHEAEQFIDKDRHLKLIYLVRDPRAILSSQMRYGEFVPKSLNSYSEMFCRTMLSDIQGYAKLKKIHPKQVIFVRYEEIAHKPIPLTEKLYDFVGLSLTQNVTKHIYNITNGGNDVDCALCISKSNSTKTAEIWRMQTTHDFVQIVDSNCKHVYQYIGYLPILNASTLTDMNIPVRTSPFHDLVL